MLARRRKSPQMIAVDYRLEADAVVFEEYPVPGSYMFLRASSSPDYMSAANNHSPLAQFDDSVLHLGVRLHAEFAIRALRRDAAVTSD